MYYVSYSYAMANISKFVANFKLKLWKKNSDKQFHGTYRSYHGDNAYSLSKGTVETSINIETVSKLQI